MPKIPLSPPAPLRNREALQPGITDPIWPATPPKEVNADVYSAQYAGTLERQRHLHIVTADVTATRCGELLPVLKRVTNVARHQMAKEPPTSAVRDFDLPLASRRVTVTVGFGATLFTTAHGDDRFDIAGCKPNWLKIIPRIDGDLGSYVPRRQAGDLIVLIASDDFYVNEYIFGLFYYGKVHPSIHVRSVERGYSRPDNREPSGFEDGTSNPRGTPPNEPMHEAVYVRHSDGEPDWCTNGTYLGYRKIRRRMAAFFNLSTREREAVLGVERTTGDRLSHATVNSHSRKMNLHRPDPDLFGMLDESRKILRRPYFFSEGLDSVGEEVRGIHHLSFARNLGLQYEWPVIMWQMNPDFPFRGAGRDVLYDIGGAANMGGGYYFFPAAPGTDGFYGDGMFVA